MYFDYKSIQIDRVIYCIFYMIGVSYNEFNVMKKFFYIPLLLLLGSVTEAYSQSKTITGGNDHGLIICAQGYLYTWGNNKVKNPEGYVLGIDPDDPQTGGNARKEFVTEPSRVKSGNLTFSQVTAGSGAFNLALACNTIVYAWGENSNGGCGQGTSGLPVEFPKPVVKGETLGYSEDGTPGGDYLGGVTYIAASTNSGFAIMDDGRVVGWGGGTWNGSTNKSSPVYIKVKQGNTLVDITNVTHISGGDDNCLIRTADGRLYGIGPWNGSTTEAVTVATPVLKEEDGEPLTDIRMSAAGDVCGFAVTGDGYVWSWGNGGWGGSTGVAQTGANHPTARKVSSGEYKTISKEEYLTDVKEVIGGRGHGAAVTKEGYLVYWGCNEKNGGVAPVDAATAKTYASGGQGVKPVLARYCDASGKPGEVVKNAVSISRGDNFDFMMNDEDKYYVWGLNDLGQCGVGTTVEVYNCLVELKTIPCEIQDNCPEVFMINQKKCPGEEIELDCGFVVPKGKEERYFIEWYYNGVVLNSSTKDSPFADRKADKYNVQSIKITDPGTYAVKIEYIGANIPCDKCKPAEAEITVEDMDMPIDTVIKDMQCVADPLNPSASDVVCFKAVVNDKFYKSTDKVTFAAFSSVDGEKDTLKGTDGSSLVFNTTGAGGEIEFCVSGDQIKTVSDNKNEPSNDTIYNVWLEDISRFETLLRKGAPGAAATGGSFQSYGMLLDMRASADLVSFDIYAKSYSGTSTITAKPVIYMAEKNENDLYVVGAKYWEGELQSFTIDDAGPNKCTVKCNVRVPGSTARGVRYILGMAFNGNCTLYDESVTVKQNSSEFATPVLDTEKFGIYEMGATANSYTSSSNGSNKTCYYNVTFGKLTDYDCGRIMLSARYGCPPCNQPDGIIKIKVDGVAHASEKDTIKLCEESDPVELSVTDIKKASEPSASFDELWFLNVIGADATALQATKSSETSVLKTKIGWVEAKAGMTEKYYVKIRDNEKPEASACYVFDSIVVLYQEKPVAPTIEDYVFCENEMDKPVIAPTLADGVIINWYADDAKSAPASEPDLKTLVAAADPYTYYYSITNTKTTCESDVKSFSVTVNAVPEETLEALTPFCKGDATVALATTSPTNSYKVTWYESDKTTAANTVLSTLAAGNYDYNYTLTSAAPANCVSDFLPYAFVVKDSTKVELDTTMACGITEVSVKSVTPSTASLAYSLGGTAVSVTTFENPTYKGEIGAIIATASADNYCDNTSAPLNLYVKATAVDPTTEKVTYLKSDAVNGVFKDLLSQNPSAVTAEDGYTLNWYATDKTTKLGACPTPAYPDASITEDQTYIYYVSATNEDGCESEKIAVEVTVFLTPAPTTSPVYYCVGAEDVVALTATVNDPNSSGKFKLNWYGLDGSNLGEDAPVPNVSAAGKFTYQVSQISTDGAESSKVDLDVIVYGVDKPAFKTSNVYEYCAAAGSGTALEVDLVRDAASYMEASDFVWSMKNASGVFETVTTPAPSLNVSATTTYEYQVYQTYTIPSTGKTCQGAPIETSVKVTFVPQLETKEVLYLKAAAVGATFANNVLAQDPTAVSGQETGATLQWYMSDCSTKISGTPTPIIDPSVWGGYDQILTYCVSQVLNGCESEPQTINVRISDALPPTTYAYHYCEGQTMEDLKADINPQPGISSDDYELYWYATQPAGTTTTPDFKGAVYSMNGAAAALDASNGVTKITYYVAQRDKATDAVSAALPVVITVYPKPVVVATDPDRVCETSVDLANSRSVANVAEPLTFEYSFEGGVPTTSSIANNSGKYSVEAYYSLPVTPSTYVVAPGLECRSTLPASITVQIDTLQDLTIDANLTTCPNTALESLEAVFTSNVAAPTYAWFNDKNMLTVTDRKQVASKDLPGVADDTYSFSVTVYAGACQLSASHTVTLGDGPVNGSIVASETINSQLDATAFATTGNAVDIYSCGTDVTLTASLDATESDFKWSVVSGSGSLSDNGKSAVVSPVTGPTTYRVTYTNKCSTSVDVNVIPMPVSASAILANSEICEDDQTTISLTYQSSEVPTITWTKDGQAYSPTSSELLSFAPAKPSDSGEYIYTVSNTHGCKVSNENEPLKLLVKPYIKVQDVAEPYIVTRGESVEMNVDIVYPTDASVSSISWTESGSEVNTGAKFTYAAVEADHNYDIVLHDDKYCDATTSVQLWVDAKLELTTSFDDTLCYSESREFVIDTTGTGPFRRNPAGVLKVVEVQDGLTTEITHLFEQRESLLVAALSPKKDASYLVSFDYNGQHLESSEAIVVLQPIEIELPAVQTVCEGTEVTIALPKVSPVGTTITWDEDPTIQSDLKAESIKVVAAFNSTAENHRATYTYGFTASYAGCQNIPMQVELLVDEPIAGEVVGETPICQGATTTLDASSFDASEYIWTASDDSTYYEMGATLTARLDSSRTFFLSMTRGTCAKDTMFDVKVTTIPEIVGVDSIGLRERKILLDPMKGTAPFQFALESEANVFPGDVAEDLTFTSHIVYVIDAVGCTNNFVFTLEAPSIFPKNVLTPDGDLVNDTWQVTNLREVYPDAKVRIFDRYGKKLIEYRGADDGWDGFYNGKAMPTTDYWYEIEIEEIDKTYVGHFTLMRR